MSVFQINPQDIRTKRQQETNRVLEGLLYEGHPPLKQLKQYTNLKELNRICEDFSCSQEEMLDLLQGNCNLSKMAAGRMSIQSSRQSATDELFMINEISKSLQQDTPFSFCKPAEELRPTHDGRVLTRKQFKAEGLNKDRDGLKSIDAVLYEGTDERGYAFAKILYGVGGHQDNVLREMNEFIQWSLNHGDKDNLYICLIDTDHDISEYRQKQTDNVWVVNHVEFQNRLRP
jgi:hypothetical protein